MIPQNRLATKDGIPLQLTFHVEHCPYLANANRALDHSKNSILTFRQYGKRFQKSGVNAPLTYRYPFQDVALLGDLGAWRLTDFFQDYARWILRFAQNCRWA